MNVSKRMICASIALWCSLVCINGAANAHVVIPPGTHLAISKHGLTVGPYSPGSLSTRINTTIIKNIIVTGYGSGQSAALSQQIASGQLTGTIYYQFSNPAFTNEGYFDTFAIGNNPFNNGFHGYVSSAPTGGNYLSFVNGFSKPGSGGTGGSMGILQPTTGSGRILNSFYKSLAGTSFNSGVNSINSLGPLKGGEFTGTFYEGAGGSGATSGIAYTNIFFAFGNNSYNTLAISSLSPSATGNFLTFAKGTVQITGGQFVHTLFQLSSPTEPLPTPAYSWGYYGFAFGKSLLNVGPTNATISYSLFRNTINFAPFTHH